MGPDLALARLGKMTDERRIHSPSSISTGRKCKHAWWLRYHKHIKPAEHSWEDVRDGKVDGRGGVKSRALGKAVHALHETHAEHGADAIPTAAWDDLPGAVLQTMLPHLPGGGTLRKDQIERKFVLEQDGVGFKGLIDVDDAEGVTDLKTTSDIRKYALLPDAVARSIQRPERSLKNDLQACTYALERARRSRPPAPHTRMKWVYGETGRSRRSLPIVQVIPTAHARSVVKDAAAFGRVLESMILPDGTGATPNTLACDDYGGCWYRAEGHCNAQRHWGGVINKRIKEEIDMASKPTLPFNQLRDRVNAANGKPGAAAAPAPAKAAPKGRPALPGRKPAPEPEPEETEADEEIEAKETDAPVQCPTTARKPGLPGRRAATAPEPEEIEEDEAQLDDASAAVNSMLEKFDEVLRLHTQAIRAAIKHALGK